jgi:mannose-6-phosphate isomerase-like protein (cupin superfamily)
LEESTGRFHLKPREGRDHVPGPRGEAFVELLRHGSMSVEYFTPTGVDTQEPHEQDELYVVVSGHGEFVNGPVRHRFATGDVMFVPAGVEHRFESARDGAARVYGRTPRPAASCILRAAIRREAG